MGLLVFELLQSPDASGSFIAGCLDDSVTFDPDPSALPDSILAVDSALPSELFLVLADADDDDAMIFFPFLGLMEMGIPYKTLPFRVWMALSASACLSFATAEKHLGGITDIKQQPLEQKYM